MHQKKIQVALIAAHSPDFAPGALEKLAGTIAEEVRPLLEDASGVFWRFHSEASSRLTDDNPRRPSEFLEESALRMVEGPYDAAIVVTNVGLVSRNQKLVPGLASGIARLAVISTPRLRRSPRGEDEHALQGEVVRSNAAALLLHLIGHLVGLSHDKAERGTAMFPFELQNHPRALPRFSAKSRSELSRLASRFPEREDLDEGALSEFSFHIRSALRHPRQVLSPVLRSWAPLLPLRLPRLATTALVPTFILIFTAEIWDAGFHMTNRGVMVFAILSILASAIYLILAQNLFLPREEKRYHTEHLAVVNVSILIAVIAGVVGLFALLGLLMLSIQLFIFPPDLIREWPSLEIVTFDLTDQIRIAALISTIGVLTGALGGGMENRALFRHLALFDKEP